MPFQPHAEGERTQWRTLPEAVAHVRATDSCDQDNARTQLRKALGDGALGPLRWEDDLRPTPVAGGATVPLDVPPGRDPYWREVDIDWEAGLITVRGKGKRVAQMPLPCEVGKALADYLATGRPQCSSRRVFIRAMAPIRSPSVHW